MTKYYIEAEKLCGFNKVLKVETAAQVISAIERLTLPVGRVVEKSEQGQILSISLFSRQASGHIDWEFQE